MRLAKQLRRWGIGSATTNKSCNRRSNRKLALAAKLVFEPLEIRTLLSWVYIGSDAGSNTFYFRRNGANVQVFEDQPLTTTPVMSLPVSEDDLVGIVDGNGNNTVTVDYSGGDPINGELFIQGSTDSGANRDTLNVINTGGANFNLSHANMSIVAGGHNDTIGYTTNVTPDLNISQPGTTNQVIVNSGAFTFNSDMGAGNATVDMTVKPSASVAFGATQHLDSLNINSNGFVQMLPAGGEVLDTNVLSVAGKLDLANNDLIVNTPGYNSSASLTTLENAIATFQHSILFGGTPSTAQGIIESSTAVTDDMVDSYAPASLIPNLLTLDGQPVAPAALVARYTLEGDLNLDGSVNSADFSILNANIGTTFGTNPPLWYEGDLDFSGSVNIADFSLLNANLGNVIPGASPINVTINQPHSVSLPTQTPSGDPILRWDLNWGDGDVDSVVPGLVPGTNTPITAQHTYIAVGLREIQMSALTASGALYRAPASILSINAAGSLTALNLAAQAPGDSFIISSNASGNTIISENGAVVETVSTASLLSVNIIGDNNGTLTVDFTNGDPLPSSGLFADSSAIDITCSTGSDILFTTATTAVFGNAEIRHSQSAGVTFLNAGPGDQIVSLAGTVFIDGDSSDDGQGSANGGPSVFVNTAATVIFNGTQHLSSLTILPAGTAHMAADGTAVLVTNSLTIADQTSNYSGGVLDLADNDLIVHGGDQFAVSTRLFNGYNDGAWNDNGNWPDLEPAAIDSTIAGTFDSAGNFLYGNIETLGYAQVGNGQGDLPLTAFDNQAVATGDVVVKYTYCGDANLDGTVDSTDAAMVATGIANDLAGWTNGDFFYAGSIDGSDAAIIDNMSAMNVPAGSMSLSAVSNVSTGSLPTTLPDGTTPIAFWQADWGNGQTQTFSSGSTIANPYSNANSTYMASFVALNSNGNPIYRYPHINVTVLSSYNVSAGGPYIAIPGSTIPLTATATTEGSSVVSYEWDFNYNSHNAFQVMATGSEVAFPTPNNLTATTVAVRVTDSNGVAVIATGQVIALGTEMGRLPHYSPDTINVPSGPSVPAPLQAYTGSTLTIYGANDNGQPHTVVVTSVSVIIDGVDQYDYSPAVTKIIFIPGDSDTNLLVSGGPSWAISQVPVEVASDVPSGGELSVQTELGGIVTFDTTIHLGQLEIDTGGKAIMAAAGNDVLVTDSLIFRLIPLVFFAGEPTIPAAFLDLTNNDMIDHMSDFWVYDFDNIPNYLAGSYDSGKWDTGWILSSVAAADPADIEGLGYAQVGDGQGDLPLNSFDGETVSSGDIVIKFTYYGDANLDGSVDSTDQGIIANGISNALTGWSNGDFTYAGSVSNADTQLWETSNGMSLPPASVTLVADANFPVSSLPTTTPAGAAISNWQVDWGNEDTQIINPTDPSVETITNPYSNANSTYMASFVALNSDGNPIYYYPYIAITVTGVGPTDLSATPVSPNEIDLLWTGFSSVRYSSVDIEISTDGTNFTYFDSVGNNVDSYQAKGLLPSTSYTFEVVAEDTDQNQSTPSVASATTEIDPWDVNITGASAAQEGNYYQLTLSMDPATSAPAFDHWTVDWGDGSENQYTLENEVEYHLFAPGTAFSSIQVTASTADIEPGTVTQGSSSLTITAPPISVDIIPIAPTELTASLASSSEIDLTWADNNSLAANGYDILRSDGGGTFNLIDTVAGGVTSYADDSITDAASNTLQYEVEAFGDSQSIVSSPSTSAVLTTEPGVPELLATEGSDAPTSVNLTWIYPMRGESGFEIDMEDQSQGESFYQESTPGPIGASGYGSTTIANLNSGDTYLFRIQADITGGATSDYSQTSFIVPTSSDSLPLVTSPSGNPKEQIVSSNYTNPGTMNLGTSNGEYGFYYQTAGNSSIGGIVLGAVSGSRGGVVLKGGALSAFAGIGVGGSGYGSFTNGGAAVSLGSLQIAYNGHGASNSFFNQISGSTSIEYQLSVGSPTPNNDGLLVIGGGSFTFAECMSVQGTGSTVDLVGPISTAQLAQVSYTGPRNTLGAFFNSGTNLEFDASTGGIPELNLGASAFNSVPGSHLVLNLSNYHSSSTATYTLINFGENIGQSLSSFVAGLPTAASGYSVTYSSTTTSLRVTIQPTGIVTDSIEGAGTITSASGVNYNYAPSFMYDETEGLYKVWSCYDVVGSTGVTSHDNIGYKEYPTIAGLVLAPTTYAMSPTGNSAMVNGGLVADPSVYRDPESGDYYLAYSGTTGVKGTATNVAIAKSLDGGRTFTPIYMNAPNGQLVAPDSGSNPTKDYGVGQPAVTFADGRWYMVYTDASFSVSNTTIPQRLVIISSADPTFSSYTTISSFTAGLYATAFSVDLAFDASSNQLVIVSDATPPTTHPVGDNRVLLSYFNLTGGQLGYADTQDIAMNNMGFSFGEGVGLLKGSEGQMLDPESSSYSFLASTLNSSSIYPSTVHGPLSYISGVFPGNFVNGG